MYIIGHSDEGDVVRVAGFLLMAAGVWVLGLVLSNSVDYQGAPVEVFKDILNRQTGLSLSLGVIAVGAIFFCSGVIAAAIEKGAAGPGPRSPAGE